jgi:phosphatidylglycerophosphate synthase
MSQIESTYKARDVEETIDVYFYRPLGYYTARGCRVLGLSPNAVTIISIVIGIVAGHFLWYRDISLNLLAFGLWIVADILDSADGQLARMINHKSKLGRILDGFGGNLIFLSMYLHLMARMAVTFDVHWYWMFGVVLAGGLSHSVQSAISDYFRNAYLRYGIDPNRSELDSSSGIRKEYESLSYSADFVKKAFLRLYLNYTLEQEALTKNFQKLRRRVDAAYGTAIPSWFSDEYRRTNKPLMKYYAILTTNTRMIVMCCAVLLDVVPLYFVTEVVVINAVLLYAIARQEKISVRLAAMVGEREGVPA